MLQRDKDIYNIKYVRDIGNRIRIFKAILKGVKDERINGIIIFQTIITKTYLKLIKDLNVQTQEALPIKSKDKHIS